MPAIVAPVGRTGCVVRSPGPAMKTPNDAMGAHPAAHGVGVASSVERAHGGRRSVHEHVRLTQGAIMPTTTIATVLDSGNGGFAAEMLPQAVSTGGSNGHVFAAIYRPDGTVNVVDINPDTGTATAFPLTAADGSLERFVTASATTAASNGNLNDSHNNLAIALDRQGYIHVAGDVHNAPLKYWRSLKPLDASTMRNSQQPGPMQGVWVVKDKVGNETRRYLNSGAERGATCYPDLFHGPGGQLFFAWRAGASARGNWMLYRYDEQSQQWSSTAGVSMQYAPYPDGYPLIEGISSNLSPYPTRPVAGPDGRYWMVWAWRSDANRANSNGRLCAAHSTDLTAWHGLDGSAMTSMNFATASVIVDDLPLAGSGLLNNQTPVGFDAAAQPVIAYFKGNASSGTQITTARPNGTTWQQTTIASVAYYDLDNPTSATIVWLGTPQPASGGFRLNYSSGTSAQTATVNTANNTITVAPQAAPAGNTRTTSATTYPGLTSRQVDGESFTTGSTSEQWHMQWDSGPYVSDGTRPNPTTPPNGTPIRYVLTQET